MNDYLFQMDSRIKPSEPFIVLSNKGLHELIHTISGYK